MRKIRIGSGAGYGGDRIEPAIDLMENGELDYLIFECLAERTIALANLQKTTNPELGYNHLLEYRFQRVLEEYKKGNKIKIVTNMGAANPYSAAKKVVELAASIGVKVKVAAVLGDDVFSVIDKYMDEPTLETKEPLSKLKENIVSANAYIGCAGISEALDNGAEIIITGRVADPSLTLGILVHEFKWSMDNYDLLGKGTIAGHLLECAGQVTGGYYYDGDKKDVPDLWNLGFPIAIISEDGSLQITKTNTSGGLVNEMTCQEQTLYEIQDPENYYTPDCIANFKNVKINQLEKDLVDISGVTGKASNGKYKVSVGYQDCYIGEGQISYGGYNAYKRALKAKEVLEKRLELTHMELDEVRFDFIGVNSLYGNTLNNDKDYHEIRLRLAARTKDYQTALRVGQEVEAMYTNGPSGGGGVSQSVRKIVSVASILINQDEVKHHVEYLESGDK